MLRVWNCTACTFENNGLLQNCEVCNTPRAQQQQKQQQQQQQEQQQQQQQQSVFFPAVPQAAPRAQPAQRQSTHTQRTQRRVADQHLIGHPQVAKRAQQVQQVQQVQQAQQAPKVESEQNKHRGANTGVPTGKAKQDGRRRDRESSRFAKDDAKESVERNEKNERKEKESRKVLGKEERVLKELDDIQNELFRHKETNVENAGIYLRNVTKAYRHMQDKSKDYGYVSFGIYARNFGECFTIIKAKVSCKNIDNLPFGQKIELCKNSEKNERFKSIYKSVDQIRALTNQIAHSVHDGVSARKRFLTDEEKRKVLYAVYDVAKVLHSWKIKNKNINNTAQKPNRVNVNNNAKPRNARDDKSGSRSYGRLNKD